MLIRYYYQMKGFSGNSPMQSFRLMLAATLLLLPAPGLLAAERYAERFCEVPGFYCLTVEEGDSWESLFPFAEHRDTLMRLNRMNIRLRPGMRIAVPEDIDFVTPEALAPFAPAIEPAYSNRIVIDLDELAWGAYSAEGELLKWGPISGGKDYCADVKQPCPTLQGDFIIYRTGTGKCKSKKFPIGKGGAKMPWCMFYDGGYAIHGSYEVPGYHASHGCVRTFIEDAHWLNRYFIHPGWTRVIIR
jgi:hypothetical protein